MRKRNLFILLSLMFTLNLTSCSGKFFAPQGPKGEVGVKGETGLSVKSIVLSTSTEEFDIYTIIYSDGTSSFFKVVHGVDGNKGIEGLPGDNGYTPKVEISANGMFMVDNIETNIKATGPKGEIGDKGENGVSVIAITKYKEDENKSYYMITYSDGNTSKFTITHGVDGKDSTTNGKHGVPGIQGEPGVDGHTPTIYISHDGYFVIDNEKTNIVAKGYTGEKGDRGVSIISIKYSKTVNDLDVYIITYDDGTTSMYTVPRGEDGIDGNVGIKGIEGIQGIPGDDGYTPEITIGQNGNWFVDGDDSGKQAQGPQGEKGEVGDPGKDGRSVVSIDFSKSVGKDDVYIITYNDGTTSSFNIPNGQGLKGIQGEQGIQGNPGKDGTDIKTITINESGYFVVDGVATNIKAIGERGDRGETGNPGVSVISITLFEETPEYETYIITYSNETTTKFKVQKGTNGQQGIQGIQGEPGPDGHTPVVEIKNGYWFVDGVYTGLYVKGSKGPKGKSAYEIYVETHPNYRDRGEKQWLDDLILGNLNTTNVHKVTYTVDGEILKTEMVKDGYNAERPYFNSRYYTYSGWFYKGIKWIFEANAVTKDIELTGTKQRVIYQIDYSDRVFNRNDTYYFLPGNPPSKLPVQDISLYENLEFLGFAYEYGDHELVTDVDGNFIISKQNLDTHSNYFEAKYHYTAFPSNANLRIKNEDALISNWPTNDSYSRRIDFKYDKPVAINQLVQDGLLEITSSNSDVISVEGFTLRANSEGDATITIKFGSTIYKTYNLHYGERKLNLDNIPFKTKKELLTTNIGSEVKVKGKIIKISSKNVTLQDGDNIYRLNGNYFTQNNALGDNVIAGGILLNSGIIESMVIQKTTEEFLTPIIDLSNVDYPSEEQFKLYEGGIVKVKGISRNKWNYVEAGYNYQFNLQSQNSDKTLFVDVNQGNFKDIAEFNTIANQFITDKNGYLVTICGFLNIGNISRSNMLTPVNATDFSVVYDDTAMINACLNDVLYDFEFIGFNTNNYNFSAIKPFNPDVTFKWTSSDPSIINVDTGAITHGEKTMEVTLTLTGTLNQAEVTRQFKSYSLNKVDTANQGILFDFDSFTVYPENGYKTYDFCTNNVTFSVVNTYYNHEDYPSGSFRLRKEGSMECKQAYYYTDVSFTAKTFNRDPQAILQVMYKTEGSASYSTFEGGDVLIDSNNAKTYHVKLPIDGSQKVSIKFVLNNGNRVSFDDLRFYNDIV